MGKRWKAPKGVGVVYKGKGFRKKANVGKTDENERNDEGSDEDED